MKKLLIVLAFLLIASPLFASSVADKTTLSAGSYYNMLGESVSGTSVTANYPSFMLDVEIPTAKGQSISIGGAVQSYTISTVSVNLTQVGVVYKIELQ